MGEMEGFARRDIRPPVLVSILAVESHCQRNDEKGVPIDELGKAYGRLQIVGDRLVGLPVTQRLEPTPSEWDVQRYCKAAALQ
jgi:hypothetical protein